MEKLTEGSVCFRKRETNDKPQPSSVESMSQDDDNCDRTPKAADVTDDRHPDA